MYIRNWASPKKVDNFVLDRLIFFLLFFSTRAPGVLTFVETNWNLTCRALVEFNSYSIMRFGPKFFKIELFAPGDSNPQLSALK